MKVKILQSLAGSHYDLQPGAIVELDNEEGKRLCAAGFAEQTKDAVSKGAQQKLDHGLKSLAAQEAAQQEAVEVAAKEEAARTAKQQPAEDSTEGLTKETATAK